eukprot:366265-Chlamydomonas_euryale.AAC.11
MPRCACACGSCFADSSLAAVGVPCLPGATWRVRKARAAYVLGVNGVNGVIAPARRVSAGAGRVDEQRKLSLSDLIAFEVWAWPGRGVGAAAQEAAAQLQRLPAQPVACRGRASARNGWAVSPAWGWAGWVGRLGWDNLRLGRW